MPDDMPDDTKKVAPSLKFVHISDPGEIHTKRFRREVRSHVTFRQHSRQRQKKLQRARESNADQQVKLEVGEPEEDGVETERSTDSPDSIASASLSRTASSTLEKSFSQGTAAFGIFALNDSSHTIGTTLNNLATDASAVLGMYNSVVLVQSKHIQQGYSTGTQPKAAHQRWMSFVFADPITLTMAMLVGTRCLLSPAGQTVSTVQNNHLLQLKDFLINSINGAIKDDKRRVSNHMLICIALLASYESKYESEDSHYHMHMRGLVRMVQMRGGLRTIGLETPWVERVLIWSDINSAKVIGGDPYFKEHQSSSFSKRPEADLEVYNTRG